MDIIETKQKPIRRRNDPECGCEVGGKPINVEVIPNLTNPLESVLRPAGYLLPLRNVRRLACQCHALSGRCLPVALNDCAEQLRRPAHSWIVVCKLIRFR